MKIFGLSEFVEKIKIDPISVSDLDSVEPYEFGISVESVLRSSWYKNLCNHELVSHDEFYRRLKRNSDIEDLDKYLFDAVMEETYQKLRELEMNDDKNKFAKAHVFSAEKVMDKDEPTIVKFVLYYFILRQYGPVSVNAKVDGKMQLIEKSIDFGNPVLVSMYHKAFLESGWDDNFLNKMFLK